MEYKDAWGTCAEYKVAHSTRLGMCGVQGCVGHMCEVQGCVLNLFLIYSLSVTLCYTQPCASHQTWPKLAQTCTGSNIKNK